LRVYDSHDREIPYVIIENKSPESKPVNYSLEIIEYKEELDASTITIKLPEKFEPIVRLKLDILDHDFKKDAELHGSFDMQTWSLLARDSIYDFSSQVDLKKTEIEFPKSSYRYYRLKLSNPSKTNSDIARLSIKYNGLDLNLDDVKTKTVKINDFIGETLSEKNSTIYDEAGFTEFIQVPGKNQDTVIVLEANLPLNKLSFDIDNPYFYRKIRVYYSDTGEEDSYQFLTEQPIYRFSLSSDEETKTSILCEASKHRFYKIVIDNGNNPLLELKRIKLEWVRKDLFFVALNESDAYTLRFGSQDAERPNYDLGNFVNQSNWMRRPYEELEISLIHENSDYQASLPKDKKVKYEKMALRFIVICLVIAIGSWLYRLMRRMT